MTDLAPKIWVSGFGSAMEKWGYKQVEHGFSSFFVKFLAHLLIFQSLAGYSQLHDAVMHAPL